MLTKARLSGSDFKDVEFQFNPETLSFTSAAEAPRDPAQTESQFVGPKPITLTLKMLLDEVSSRTSVQDRISTLVAWTRKQEGKEDRAVITFTWGTLKVGGAAGLKGHCESVAVTYQLFDPSGVPMRAEATVVLKEKMPPPEPHNPTSGGEFPVRSHVLRAGDDLAVITHAEYGSTSRWRDVAERNGVDNPFRLPLGREVILPDPRELER